MSNSFPFQKPDELQEWYYNIEQANRNNVFCHCRACDYEWVDSSKYVMCKKCSSKEIETISCWQFPDD